MAILRFILAIYIAAPYYLGNVSAYDLDLAKPFGEGLPLERRSEDGSHFIVVKGTNEKEIGRVVNGAQEVWEPKIGHFCKSVTLQTFENAPGKFVIIESTDGKETLKRYFEAVGGIFEKINVNEYRDKLAKIAVLGSYDPNFPSQSSPPVYSAYEIPNANPGRAGGEPSAPAAKGTVFDITDVEKYPNIACDKEIYDGVPNLVARPREGENVTAVYEGDKKLWECEGDCRLVILTANDFDGEYKLAEVFYTQNEEEYTEYFRKELREWRQINAPAYDQTFHHFKSKIVLSAYIALNLADFDKKRIYQKAEAMGDKNVYTYFPLPGNWIMQVQDGAKILWKSNLRRCVAATAVVSGNSVELLKLEIVGSKNYTSKKFYLQSRGDYYEITAGDYSELFAKTADLDMLNQTIESADENENSGEAHEPQPEQSKNEPSEDRSTADDGITLQLSEGSYPYADEDVHRGITFRTFAPPAGKVFTAIKLGKTVIWQAGPDEHTDFVRMFYPNGQPKLGFLKIVTKNEGEEDKYFIRDRDGWAFVVPNKFLDAFNYFAPEPQTESYEEN